MIQPIALGIVILGAGWLVFVAGLCLAAPERARAALGAMGSTWPVHAVEHVLRATAGAALVIRADLSKFPAAFEIAGWFMVVSSALILILPRRWHHAYAAAWAKRIPLWMYRVLAIPALVLAGALFYAAS
ncbi:hypothetical protein [Altererythrobacter aquiaggeris]|uniref:hypothetical protein n=1 Tax=Aestuarierythrobacter aquiaggeris TaxID=1898396 RepID=UPI003019CC5C